MTPVGAAAVGLGLILVNPKVLVMNAGRVGDRDLGLGLPGAWLAVTYYTVIAWLDGC